MVTLPFPADSQWAKTYVRNNSYSQLILKNYTHLALSQLLADPEKYHQQLVRVRGQVTRLELHLDKTKYFIDFVFFLKDGKERLLVFGRHDRTNGDIQLTSDHMVEVKGRFWKERMTNGHRLTNNLEAYQVIFYPPKSPDHAKNPHPNKAHLAILKDTECQHIAKHFSIRLPNQSPAKLADIPIDYTYISNLNIKEKPSSDTKPSCRPTSRFLRMSTSNCLSELS